MKPIIRWTLWQRRWFTIWWSLGVAAFVVLSLSFYASFRDQAAQFNEVLNRLPATARSLFSDNNDFLSPQGFLSARVYYLMLPLILGVLAVGLGSKLIAKEEESTTLELLLARPVSRAKLLLAKAVSGLIILFAVSLVGLVATIVVCQLVKLKIPLESLSVATAACFLLVLSFGALAFAMSAIGGWAKTAATGLTALIALGGYIVVSLAVAVDWLKWPAKLFPYHYYRPSEILYGVYNWWNLAVFGGLIIIFGILAWKGFKERDLNG